MSALTLYFDPLHAVGVHDWIIEHSGGLPGLKDLGLLESVLEHIQNDDYYPTFDAKLSHLIFGINKFHAFNDGNKRASVIFANHYLISQGGGMLIIPEKEVPEFKRLLVAFYEDRSNDIFLFMKERCVKTF